MVNNFIPEPINTHSSDFGGSRDEWVFTAARALANRYAAGDQSMLDNLSGATGPIGQPDRRDFGSTQGGASTGTMSNQTWTFWVNYVRAYADTDPYLANQFGPPPSRSATYVPDPNSPSAVSGTFAERSAFDREQNALNRANDLAIAGMYTDASRYAADQQLAGVMARVGADLQIAAMQDATQRYIAEGNWGVQRYIAELQEQGAMERLQLQLGFEREVLAQRALEERNRHTVAIQALALEVAKYDAELAASPRNWLKYQAWLQSRSIIVNGLTLAMAAQEVPESEIDPALVANVTGSNLAAIQTAQEQTVSGMSGGSFSDQDPFGSTVPMTSGAPMAATTAAPAPVTSGSSAQEMANSLLGQEPAGGSATTEELQAIMDSLSTTGQSRPQPGFGAWGGPTTNALGVDIGPEVEGSQVDYRKFTKLLPTQQEMKVGGIQSVRGEAGISDWIAELDRSRPKGRATGSATFG